jgi:hypothetical protein
MRQTYTVSAGMRWQVPFMTCWRRRLLLDPQARAFLEREDAGRR